MVQHTAFPSSVLLSTEAIYTWIAHASSEVISKMLYHECGNYIILRMNLGENKSVSEVHNWLPQGFDWWTLLIYVTCVRHEQVADVISVAPSHLLSRNLLFCSHTHEEWRAKQCHQYRSAFSPALVAVFEAQREAAGCTKFPIYLKMECGQSLGTTGYEKWTSGFVSWTSHGTKYKCITESHGIELAQTMSVTCMLPLNKVIFICCTRHELARAETCSACWWESEKYLLTDGWRGEYIALLTTFTSVLNNVEWQPQGQM